MTEQELREKLEGIIVETPAEHAIYTVLAEEIVKRIMPTITQYGDQREEAGRVEGWEDAILFIVNSIKIPSDAPMIRVMRSRIAELKAEKAKYE